jgi:hypothetical protein
MKRYTILLIVFLMPNLVSAMDEEASQGKPVVGKLRFTDLPHNKERVTASPRTPTTLFYRDQDGMIKKLGFTETNRALCNQFEYNCSNFFRNFFCYCKCNCESDYDDTFE